MQHDPDGFRRRSFAFSTVVLKKSFGGRPAGRRGRRTLGILMEKMVLGMAWREGERATGLLLKRGDARE